MNMPSRVEVQRPSSGTAAPARRIVFVGHASVLSGTELGLLEMAAHFGGTALVCLFADGPLAPALRERGVRVEALNASRATLDVRREGGVGSMLRSIPGVVALVRALVRLTGPDDVIYANSQKAWVVAAIVGRLWRRTVVWHLHDILSAGHFSAAMRWIAVFLANRVAACVIVNSIATGESFVEQGGRRELLRVVYNGIDPALLIVPETQRAVSRRQLGLDEATVAVGLFGRITRWKGQHILLKAIAGLPRVEAFIVGGALFGEEDYLQELQRLAADPALGGRVKFLGHRKDVAALMNAMDMVVHASIEPEPFGRVIVEGMLAQRPVIATAAGGVPEIIEGGVDGVLVPPNDAGALARAIDALASDPVRARRLALAGHRKALQRFTAVHMLLGIEDALQSIAVAD